jgi:membrane protein
MASWKLFRQALAQWSEHNAMRSSAALAYYAVLSLAPLIVIIVAIVGFLIGQHAASGQVAAQLSGALGQRGAQEIETIIKNAHRPAAGIAASAISIIVLVFSASGVFGELRESLDLIWNVRKKSTGFWGTVKAKAFAFLMVIAAGLILFAAMLLSTAVSLAGKLFRSALPVPEWVLHIASMAISFLILTLVFAIIFKFVPDAKVAWKDVWTGAAVTAALFTVGQLLLGIYLGKASFSSAYGAAGSLLVLLVWVYYSAAIFFFGAEFTQAYANTYGSCVKGSTMKGSATR